MNYITFARDYKGRICLGCLERHFFDQVLDEKSNCCLGVYAEDFI